MSRKLESNYAVTHNFGSGTMHRCLVADGIGPDDNVPNMDLVEVLGVDRALLGVALDYFETEGMIYSQSESLTRNEPRQRFHQQADYQEVACKIYYCMHISDRK